MIHHPGDVGAIKLLRSSEGAALKEVPEFRFTRVDGALPKTSSGRIEQREGGEVLDQVMVE